jgi:hypothetical protein
MRDFCYEFVFYFCYYLIFIRANLLDKNISELIVVGVIKERELLDSLEVLSNFCEFRRQLPGKDEGFLCVNLT